MAAKKKVKATKVKKKKWVAVIAPKSFNSVHIGDTHVAEDEEVLKKSLSLNLGTVLGDMRKQSYHARFDVTSVKENKAQTALVSLTMTPSGVKRLIRRGRTKIEDSFLAKLRTGQIVRIKPVIVTINTCSKPTATAIRHAIRAKLKEVLASSSIEEFIQEIIGNKIQKVLKTVAQGSHPVRSADIRTVQLLPASKKDLAELQTQEEEEAPQEEAPKVEVKKEEAKPAPKKEEAPAKEAEPKKEEEKAE